MVPISLAYNIDCMEYMKTVPDKFFDLAVVDPPYGDGEGGKCENRFGGMFGAVYGENTRAGRRKEAGGGYNRFGGWFDRYKYLPPRRSCKNRREMGGKVR